MMFVLPLGFFIFEFFVLILAIGCFIKGYIVAGILCFQGFLFFKYRFVFLTIATLFLFMDKHWIAGCLPLMLLGWSISPFFNSALERAWQIIINWPES